MHFKLLILVFSVQIVSVIFGVILVFVGTKMCMTRDCIELAPMINTYLEPKIPPCDNFYLFACGNMIQGNKSDISLVKEAFSLSKQKIADFIDSNNDEGSSKPEVFKKAKLFYKQCLEKESTSEMKHNLQELLKRAGVFPALDEDQWSEDKWSLLEALSALRSQGLYTEVFFSIDLKPNPSDTSKYIPSVSVQKPYAVYSPQFLATCGDLLCNVSLPEFYSSILSLAGVNESAVSTLADEMLALDVRIAKLYYKLQPTFPHQYKDRVTTVDNFTATFDFFDWKTYFIKIMSPTGGKKSSFQGGSSIIVEYPDYLAEIKSIIESTPKIQLANYVMWYNLFQLLYIPKVQRNSQSCLSTYMSQTMPILLTSLAVKVRDETGYGIIRNMLGEIKREFINEIQLANWLDDSTKKEALEKMEHMGKTIGYFKIFLNDSLLDEFYDGLTVGKNFLETYHNILKHKTKQELYCFEIFFDDELCKLLYYASIKLFLPNAFYNVMANEIIIPDSILHGPVFKPNWPDYMNYGRLGYILGHELTHSLDTSGSHYDKDGKLRNWWDKGTFDKFQQKAKCFVDQFNKFKFYDGNETRNVDGERTVGENIADNGGVRISFGSYKKARGLLPDLLLPTVGFTQEQLFFISLAQFHCKEYYFTEYPAVFYDIHAPNIIRVIGMMQNSPEFSEAFECKPGRVMNPLKKCSLW